jgi:D-alanine-D-alanine ligase
MHGINPDWWKGLFDETYLISDSRSVCNKEITAQEVDYLVEKLSLEKTWTILDLCGGQGRHCLELARRGYQDITVLDYSSYLLSLGENQAKNEKKDVLFIQGDARDIPLKDNSYRSIFVMASSFGYFIDEWQNERILREAYRILMPEGTFLLDLPDRDYILENLAPQSWHEAENRIVVCRGRTIEDDIIYSRELVISKDKGLIRDMSYCTRLYSDEKIADMLKSAGFSLISIEKNFKKRDTCGDYGCMTNRMVVFAGKNL